MLLRKLSNGLRRRVVSTVNRPERNRAGGGVCDRSQGSNPSENIIRKIFRSVGMLSPLLLLNASQCGCLLLRAILRHNNSKGKSNGGSLSIFLPPFRRPRAEAGLNEFEKILNKTVRCIDGLKRIVIPVCTLHAKDAKIVPKGAKSRVWHSWERPLKIKDLQQLFYEECQIVCM